MALTKRQKDVLDCLADFIEANGYSPSYEEIASALQLASLATVHKHVSALEAKSYLYRSYNQSRSLEIAPKYLNERKEQKDSRSGAADMPLLGRIAAGAPVEAIAGAERLHFNDFLGKADSYALEVRGESMIEDHICSGDFVLIERTSEVKDGDIVVALVDGSEATLKRFYREPNGMVRLQPANAAMQPIYLESSSVEIQGRLLAVLRKFK